MNELKKQLIRCFWFNVFKRAVHDHHNITHPFKYCSLPKDITQQQIKQHVLERIRDERATATRS